MPGVTFVFYLFLLQEPVRYFKEDNPVEAMIVLIAVGALIAFVVVFNLIRNASAKTVIGKTTTYVTPRKFNGFALRRVASDYGLDREQRKLLEYVFRNDNVTDPVRVMKNHEVLDRHFKRTYKIIERKSSDEEETQNNFLRLFSLRNTIEAAEIVEDASSIQISENAQAILTYGKENYNVRILVSQGRNIVTDTPKNLLGTPLKLGKGTNVTISLFTKSGNGFVLGFIVVGPVNTHHGPGLQMSNTGKAKPLTKRKYRRKQVSLRCEIFPAQIVENGKGKKKTTKLVVSSKKFAGTIHDISVGGCAIKTSAPVLAGSRIKLNVDLGSNNRISVLGQIVRSNRSSSGTIIHVKFTRVPGRAYNLISAMVFGYSEDL